MAGLSDATLVIEASEKSGTLITARMALDYNRDVLAVPGSIFSPASTGSNWLLRQGAAPIRSGRDIIESLRLPLDDTPIQQALFDNLTEDEAKIVNRLKTEPLERDLLLRAVGLNPVQGNIILMTMEIKGLIKETQGEIRLCR